MILTEMARQDELKGLRWMVRTIGAAFFFLSMASSMDTAVYKAQTHSLGGGGDALPATIKRIAISLDAVLA